MAIEDIELHEGLALLLLSQAMIMWTIVTTQFDTGLAIAWGVFFTLFLTSYGFALAGDGYNRRLLKFIEGVF